MKRKAWNKGFCHLSDEAKKRIGRATKSYIKKHGHPRGMLGKKHSEATRKKMGRKMTEEERLKRGSKLEKHWAWVGRTKTKCAVCKKEFEYRKTRVRKYCSYACVGKSKRVNRRCLECKKPVKNKTKEWLRCKKCSIKFTVGAKNPNWKGGITPINKLIRMSERYKKWRERVFKRDNWTCQICGKVGGKLNADHIKSFALFPKLRFKLSNGRTLCVPCHKKTENYGFTKSNVK